MRPPLDLCDHVRRDPQNFRQFNVSAIEFPEDRRENLPLVIFLPSDEELFQLRRQSGEAVNNNRFGVRFRGRIRFFLA